MPTDPPPPSPTTTSTSPSRRRSTPSVRYGFVDALRGFALAGILFVNIPDITGLGYLVAEGYDSTSPSATVLNLAVGGRLVPIFAVLFGLSMALILQGARARGGQRGWLAVLCRLALLAVIGALHGLLYPGEVLRFYALAGLLVLPLLLFTPRLVQLLVGSVLTVLGFALLGGGITATPGLMLLGAAGAGYGLPRVLESGGRRVVVVFLASTVLTLAALGWQSGYPGDPRFSLAGTVTGLVMAVTYVSGLSLLWQTPARRVIAAVFDPLGRLALTNYVGATLLVIPLGLLLGFGQLTTPLAAIGLAVAVLLGQSLLSRAWAAHFRQGPLEWLWRVGTWRRWTPLRREVAAG